MGEPRRSLFRGRTRGHPVLVPATAQLLEAADWSDVVDLDEFELVHVDLGDAWRLVASRRPAENDQRRSRWAELEPLLASRRPREA